MRATTLSDRLGYAFRDSDLLRRALTHRSFGADHNERLEFVGDAVLGCAIAAALYRQFPRVPEGVLSRLRSALVDEPTLARLAVGLGLDSALRLGKAEVAGGGAPRPSILADALEAIFGAVLVDGGYDDARAVVEKVYAAELAVLDPAAMTKDPKTRLQEWLQAQEMSVPEYVVTAVTGEAHAQTFTVECRISALDIATRGSGTSRRAAEQMAAAAAYDTGTARTPSARGARK
jgi:ribonuclease-3